MTVEVQFVRGNSTTTPPASTYVGPIGQAIVDTDLWALRIQDDSTPGGHLLSPGGAPFTLDPVTTGTSHSVTLSSAKTITYWSSATAGAKATNIPASASANAGYEFVIKTTLGNGDIHTITPASGTIDGNSSFSFPDAKSSFSMVADGAGNWMII